MTRENANETETHALEGLESQFYVPVSRAAEANNEPENTRRAQSHAEDTEPKPKDGPSGLSKSTIQNRRLTYLDRTNYASSPEVQQRLFPFLFEKLVVRHKTRNETLEEIATKKARTLTNVLLDAGDHMQKLQRQRDRSDEEKACDQARHDQEQAIADMTPKEVLKDREKSREFLEKMVREKFLAGEDDEFDYSTVDEKDDWDDWDTLEEDFRAKYFDDETPENKEGKVLTGETGIQDF